MKRTFVTLVLLGATATPAVAQAQAGFVRGFGGMTFMSETGGVFGGTVGVRINESLDVIGDAGRLTNMLPRKIQRDLDVAARAMGTLYGAPLTIDGKAPGFYALGGLRASHTMGQRMKVFVEGGAGMARGTSAITAHAGSLDVSREVRNVLHIKRSERRALVAIGGGIQAPVRDRLAFDLGYRFTRVFTDDPRIDTATMTAGFTVGF